MIDKSRRLKWYDSGLSEEPLDIGIISTADFMMYIRYRVYLQEMKVQKSERQALLKAAERNKCDEKTIRDARDFFQ